MPVDTSSSSSHAAAWIVLQMCVYADESRARANASRVVYATALVRTGQDWQFAADESATARGICSSSRADEQRGRADAQRGFSPSALPREYAGDDCFQAAPLLCADCEPYLCAWFVCNAYNNVRYFEKPWCCKQGRCVNNFVCLCCMRGMRASHAIFSTAMVAVVQGPQ